MKKVLNGMDAQELNLAAASSTVEEMQVLIEDQESQFQLLLVDLVTSCDVTEEAVDSLRWTVDSLRAELQDARTIVRAVARRLTEAEATLR